MCLSWVVDWCSHSGNKVEQLREITANRTMRGKCDGATPRGELRQLEGQIQGCVKRKESQCGLVGNRRGKQRSCEG